MGVEDIGLFSDDLQMILMWCSEGLDPRLLMGTCHRTHDFWFNNRGHIYYQNITFFLGTWKTYRMCMTLHPSPLCGTKPLTLRPDRISPCDGITRPSLLLQRTRPYLGIQLFAQWFPNLSLHQNQPESLLNTGPQPQSCCFSECSGNGDAAELGGHTYRTTGLVHAHW